MKAFRTLLKIAERDLETLRRALGDPPPDAVGWTVAIPERFSATPLLLARCGITSSGATARYLEAGGRRYSHIVDPRTGRALTNPISATVVAPDATTSDALGTAICVMGEADGARMIEDYAGASARIVVRSPARDRVLSTRGFPEVR